LSLHLLFFVKHECDNRTGSLVACKKTIRFGSSIDSYDHDLIKSAGLELEKLCSGLNDNFAYSLNPSNVTYQYWSNMDDAVWKQSTEYEYDTIIQNGYKALLYQLVGKCGQYNTETASIKKILIPNINMCTLQEKYIAVGNARHLDKIAGSNDFKYSYHLHQIGIDFRTYVNYTNFPGLLAEYEDFILLVKQKFANHSITLNSKDVWRNFLRVSCPWSLMGETKTCRSVNRSILIPEKKSYQFFQLIGTCGDVTVYTDFVKEKIEDV